MRIVAQTVVGVVSTLLLMWLVIAGFNLIDSADPVGAFFSDAPSLMFGAFWIALGLWVLLVIVGNVVHRNRPPGARVLHHLLSAAGASVVNVIVFIVIGFTAGGWAMLLVAIVLTAAAAFLVAAGVAIPLTHLVLFRGPRPGTPAPATAPDSSAPATS